MIELGTSIGIPPERDFYDRICPATCFRDCPGHKWHGLTVQELAIELTAEEMGTDIPARRAPHPVVIRRVILEDGRPTYLMVWLAMVRMPDSGLVVRAQWFPELADIRFFFDNVPYNATDRQLTDAKRALRMWREEKFSGGRAGATLERDQALFEEIVRTYLDLEVKLNEENDDLRGKEVTQRDVADGLYSGVTRISDLLARCSLPPGNSGIKWWQVQRVAREYRRSGIMPQVSWHS